MRIKSILVLLPLFFIVACDEPVKNGVVVDKIYDDEDSYYIPPIRISGTTTCSGGYNNQPQICTKSADIYIPGYWQTDPERWILKIETEDGKTRETTVSKAMYDQCNIDDWYDKAEQWCGDFRPQIVTPTK